MFNLIFGFVLIAFTVFAVLPNCPLEWGEHVINFLKGSVPVLAAFAGIICVFIGIADIKDRVASKREEKEAKKRASENVASNSDK